MEEKIVYEAEELGKAPVETDDWRVQEMYNMAPDAVMGELLTLSEAIHDSKLLCEESRFELRQARERLELMEVQVLQAALDSDEAAQVSGKNAEERKRKAAIYLAGHPTIQELAFEIKPLENLEVTTRLAMEALLDRQKNLRIWARMFEAQGRLLATVRAPGSLKEVGHILAKAYREPVLTKAAIDEYFADVPEADEVKASVERYKVDESVVPSL